MQTASYLTRRQELTQYFDRTAAQAWERLTSNEPVGRIRATVRAGRDRIRNCLLDWLPADLADIRVLDAGCGTGAFAIEAARRGAHVVAIDVSPTLVDIASQRTPAELASRIHYAVGDMLAPGQGSFDYVVAMDSLIHYAEDDMLNAITALAQLSGKGVIGTFAPRTPALSVMHAVGRLLPKRENRAPAIEPIAENRLRQGISTAPALAEWQLGRTERVSSGFYISQAWELIPR